MVEGPLKITDCPNYDLCRDVAANRNCDFTCEGCDKKTPIFEGKKKRGPNKGGFPKTPKTSIEPEKPKRTFKPKNEPEGRNRVTLDFSNYPELYEQLEKDAVDNFRSMPMQLLYACKKGYDKLKNSPGPEDTDETPETK